MSSATNPHRCIVAVVYLFCFHVLSVTVINAEPHSPSHHGTSALRSVISLDVYADGPRLYLLTARTEAEEAVPALLYHQSTDGGVTWSEPVHVNSGMAPAHSLQRGKDAQICAIGDSLIVVWTTPGSDPWGSGPLATAVSSDNGKTWQSGPNPADDNLTTGHGFIDIAGDREGRFHLTWLDSRDGSQGLRYSCSKDDGATWAKNITVKPSTCECCSNAISAGSDGTVAILFRNKNPRDMHFVLSSDHGITWNSPVPAVDFNWQLEGCPHVGGGLALVNQNSSTRIHSLSWTGVEGKAGIYHTAFNTDGSQRSASWQIGDSTASHPDLAANNEGRLAAVWDSRADGYPSVWVATSRDAGQSWSQPVKLSAEDVTAKQPRVVATPAGFRAIWTENRSGEPVEWNSSEIP